MELGTQFGDPALRDDAMSRPHLWLAEASNEFGFRFAQAGFGEKRSKN